MISSRFSLRTEFKCCSIDDKLSVECLSYNYINHKSKNSFILYFSFQWKFNCFRTFGFNEIELRFVDFSVAFNLYFFRNNASKEFHFKFFDCVFRFFWQNKKSIFQLFTCDVPIFEWNQFVKQRTNEQVMCSVYVPVLNLLWFAFECDHVVRSTYVRLVLLLIFFLCLLPIDNKHTSTHIYVFAMTTQAFA